MLIANSKCGWSAGVLLACSILVTGCVGLPPGPAPWERLNGQPPQRPVASPTAPATPAVATIRGQNTHASGAFRNTVSAGSRDHWRQPMRVSGEASGQAVQPAQYIATPQSPPPPLFGAPPQPLPGPGYPPATTPPLTGGVFQGAPPPVELPSNVVEEPPVDPGTMVPFDVYVEETRTGRFMFGVGINSDAGLTGQVVIDERNFNWLRFPTSFQDFVNGTAWRGAGQGFRLEAMPGDRVQRYLVSFTEPYLLDTPISLNLSGFFYDRRFFDWDEQRLGGRVALGYRLTHDLSLSGAVRAENVNIHDPRVLGVPQLDNALGDNDLFSGRLTLTHDTRDVPFLPTEGHLIELSYEQVFGTYDYPRGELDYRKYFLMRERPDGSGRHTLSYSFRLGFTGAQTPIFENYYAGGFSTLRGFDFRGASPLSGTVTVGGQFRFLGSVEYMFPLTADDMVRAVMFCDFGTVEERIEINGEDFRVAPGFGLRLSIPALGPAPLALDLAFPVAHEDTDDIENFSFFFGFGRG